MTLDYQALEQEFPKRRGRQPKEYYIKLEAIKRKYEHVSKNNEESSVLP
jgi:hypothetical protein